MTRHGNIARAIRERLGTEIEDDADLGLSSRVVYPGFVKQDLPIDGDRWAELTIAFGAEAQITVGNSALYRSVGVGFVALYLQTVKGDAELLALADAVCNAFRGYVATVNGTTLRCGRPREPHIEGAVQPDAQDAQWLRALVTFDFEADQRVFV